MCTSERAAPDEQRLPVPDVDDMRNYLPPCFLNPARGLTPRAHHDYAAARETGLGAPSAEGLI